MSWGKCPPAPSGMRKRCVPVHAMMPKGDVPPLRVSRSIEHLTIGELESPAGAEHTLDLRENASFIGAQINHTVVDPHIGPPVLDGKIFDQPFPELHVFQTEFSRSPSCLDEHLLRHIHADNMPLGTNLEAATKQANPPPDPRSITRPPS